MEIGDSEIVSKLIDILNFLTFFYLVRVSIPDFEVSLLLGTVVGVADNLVGSSKLYLSGKKCNII